MNRTEAIVYLKCWPHMGEPAMATGKRRGVNGETEIEVRMVYCIHDGDRTVWIKRSDI